MPPTPADVGLADMGRAGYGGGSGFPEAATRLQAPEPPEFAGNVMESIQRLPGVGARQDSHCGKARALIGVVR